ncbi:MAG: citrate synthase, partial [Actinomycetota bacterium]|nr:citrate synthase [Actinomycetota bacterium]
MATPGKGLEGVVAAETALSDIDGREGRLSYVGYDIHDLVNATFEEVCYLLHHLELPNAEQLDDIRNQIAAEREPNEFAMELLPSLAQTSAPMSMLRTAVSASSAKDPDGWDTSEEANYRKAMRLIAVFPTLVAYYDRMRKDLDLVHPDESLS